MGFMKKYLSLVVPVSLVLVAALLYLPTKMIGGSLSRDVENKSLAPARQIDTMLRNVPSSRQHEMEMDYQNRYSEDALMINKLSVQTTQRALISYKIFPKPKDDSQQLFDEFAGSYCEEIKDLVKLINGRTKLSFKIILIRSIAAIYQLDELFYPFTIGIGKFIKVKYLIAIPRNSSPTF